VPTLFTAISHFPNVERYNLSSIKMCLSGGAPLPLDVKRSFEAVTKCSLVEGYGLTETSPVVSANPLFGVQKPGSIGLPFPATIIDIRSPENKSMRMAPGEIGEICITGPQVMKGYYNHPEQTSEVLIDGCFHTGDLGYMDEEGYIFVVDRLKDMIIVNGFNVYPREVEEALYEHPAIKEAAVLGVKDTYQGQAVKAFIVLKEGQKLREAALLAFLKERMATYKLPTIVEFRDSLPKTMVGKISKKDL
jgi:long-chain acyl-CoA synthetase